MRHRVCMHGAKHRARAFLYTYRCVFEPRALHSRETSEQERETARKRGRGGSESVYRAVERTRHDGGWRKREKERDRER